MRVLVGPRAGRDDEEVTVVARALAGLHGSVVFLRGLGVRTLSRPLSAAEVALVREALRGAPGAAERRAGAGSEAGDDAGVDADSEAGADAGAHTPANATIGYVCRGRLVGARASARAGAGGTATHPDCAAQVIAVTDHVNLTWRSPLIGPNDDSAGPRFPAMTGIYLPDLTAGRLSTCEGMIVKAGIVAGVFDESRPNAFEHETIEAQAYAAASSELVPVIILAAHMGLRVAAAVVAMAGSN